MVNEPVHKYIRLLLDATKLLCVAAISNVARPDNTERKWICLNEIFLSPRLSQQTAIIDIAEFVCSYIKHILKALRHDITS